MGTANTGRMAALMLAGAVAVGIAGASAAHAQAAATNVNFTDPNATLHRPAAQVSVTTNTQTPRFSNLAAPPDQTQTDLTSAPDQSGADAPRQVELELSAPGSVTGMPVDVSFAHRNSFGADHNGDLNRQGQGSEVRVGRTLGLSHQHANSDPNTHRIYAFAASDDQAVTWSPGTSSVALQDRVQIGDNQAGVTYERGNVQASVAYVQRQVSTTVGRESFSKDESFAGVTLTMRH